MLRELGGIMATIATHLEPLIEPTPSGVAKLLAAWDGLSTESQMAVLAHLQVEAVTVG